jgi:hypothetical protein
MSPHRLDPSIRVRTRAGGILPCDVRRRNVTMRIGMCLVLGLAVVAICCAGITVGRVLFQGVDLSESRPDSVFRQVLRAAPPPGVMHIRAWGHTLGMSGDAWMRFDVQDGDAVGAALKGNARWPLYGPDANVAEQWVESP